MRPLSREAHRIKPNQTKPNQSQIESKEASGCGGLPNICFQISIPTSDICLEIGCRSPFLMFLPVPVRDGGLSSPMRHQPRDLHVPVTRNARLTLGAATSSYSGLPGFNVAACGFKWHSCATTAPSSYRYRYLRHSSSLHIKKRVHRLRRRFSPLSLHCHSLALLEPLGQSPALCKVAAR